MRSYWIAGVLFGFATCALAVDERTSRVLATPAKMAKESGTPLAELFDHLRDQSQQNVFVNWKTLEAAGVKKTMPLTTDLSGLTVGEAAAKIAKEISGRDAPICFEVDDGVVTFSTAQNLARNIETRTYDVRKLLNPNDAGRAKRLEALLRRVEGIDPRSWKDNGGDLGSVKELGGQLIVTTTPAIQDRLAAELSGTLPAKDAEPAEPPKAEAKPLLDKNIPDARFDQVGLSDVVDFLRDTTQVNIFVDWASLEQAGVNRSTPVSFRLKNVSMRTLMREILNSVTPAENVGTPDVPAMCVDADGVLTVSTRRRLYAVATTTALYPVGDLIAGQSDAGAGDGRAALVKLIRETVVPASWPTKADDVGGKVIIQGNALVITQLPEVQADIANLLADLRKSGGTAPTTNR